MGRTLCGVLSLEYGVGLGGWTKNNPGSRLRRTVIWSGEKHDVRESQYDTATNNPEAAELL